MEIVRAANLVLRFLLELGALAALGAWGFGAPLLAAVLWGAFVSPRAAVAVSGPVHVALELAVFGAAAAALAAAGQRPLAVAWVAVVAINGIAIGTRGQ